MYIFTYINVCMFLNFFTCLLRTQAATKPDQSLELVSDPAYGASLWLTLPTALQYSRRDFSICSRR